MPNRKVFVQLGHDTETIIGSVNSTMTSHFKVATRLNVSGSFISIAFNPTIPVGKFRFFYSLSSQSNPHFYKSWGNIQKKP